MYITLERRAESAHRQISSALKHLKKACGKGRMLALYEEIHMAARCANRERLRELYRGILNQPLDTWNRHYHKSVELLVLCQMLLEDPTHIHERATNRHQLEQILDEDHEIGRRIRADFLNAFPTIQ